MKTGARYIRHVTSGALAGLMSFSILSTMGQAFPDKVKESEIGANGGFGLSFFPANVLGPPAGTSDPQYPNFSRADLFTLGTGGYLTYEFNTARIIDLPGPDFTVFENPVQPSSHPEQTFADTAIVAVSQDGDTWHTFPFDIISTTIPGIYNKANYIGFAGIQPSYSSTANGISPFDPAVSGGDQFDLAEVGLPHCRFVRITDSGDARHRPQHDVDDDIVNDYGNQIDPDPTDPALGESAGFDLDAMAALHTEPWAPGSSVADWSTYD